MGPGTLPVLRGIAVAVAIALAACGGDGGPSGKAAPAPAPTGDPPPARDRRSGPVGAWPGRVVFAAEADARSRLDIFVQRRRSEAPRRLTRGSLDEFSPAWSPDGRTIA